MGGAIGDDPTEGNQRILGKHLGGSCLQEVEVGWNDRHIHIRHLETPNKKVPDFLKPEPKKTPINTRKKMLQYNLPTKNKDWRHVT